MYKMRWLMSAPAFLVLLACACRWPLCCMAAQDVCSLPPANGSYSPAPGIPQADADLILVALNLEYLESEFFLFGSTGAGLDHFDPSLAAGGPAPLGAQQASLDPLIKDIIYQFGLQEVGHVRAIKQTIPSAFPRVRLDLRREVFEQTMKEALGGRMPAKFDPYANSLNYLLASYLIPYVGLTGYVGANALLQSERARRLVGGLLAVESGQDAVIRALLYERKDQEAMPNMTVGEITDKLSDLRNKLGNSSIVDEGLVVPECLGAEAKTRGNVLAGDKNSVGYARTPEQIFSIVYGTGDPSKPGGFYPDGGRGAFAEKYLK